ncbi:hypothetical protein GCM10010136_15830 [Limoniibacter endophyticus]|uniref:Uncharacterized protein n=1 Tax=Limoniibacter endophyticus TaxID=1565040 RepID=A0A8J3DGQ3_9HYPH|nr:hypothetical protein GCM10010136_15830 [Limoniibacter endophyticus]
MYSPTFLHQAVKSDPYHVSMQDMEIPTMITPELTFDEALQDPMIHQVLRADRVSVAEFSSIMASAALRVNRTRWERCTKTIPARFREIA